MPIIATSELCHTFNTLERRIGSVFAKCHFQTFDDILDIISFFHNRLVSWEARNTKRNLPIWQKHHVLGTMPQQNNIYEVRIFIIFRFFVLHSFPLMKSGYRSRSIMYGLSKKREPGQSKVIEVEGVERNRKQTTQEVIRPDAATTKLRLVMNASAGMRS